MSAMFEEGLLSARVDRAFPLEQAAAAFNYSAGSGSGGVGDHYGSNQSYKCLHDCWLKCTLNVSNGRFHGGMQGKPPLLCEMSHSKVRGFCRSTLLSYCKVAE